jgi:hypothetical protein
VRRSTVRACLRARAPRRGCSAAQRQRNGGGGGGGCGVPLGSYGWKNVASSGVQPKAPTRRDGPAPPRAVAAAGTERPTQAHALDVHTEAPQGSYRNPRDYARVFGRRLRAPAASDGGTDTQSAGG